MLMYATCDHAYAYMTHVYTGSLHAYTSMFFSLHGHTIQLAYTCGIPAYANAGPRAHASTQKPYFDYFNFFFSLIFSPDCHFNALCSSFYRSCLPSRAKAAQTVLLHGIGSWSRRQRATYMLRALSLSSVCYQRPLPEPFWCSPWFRGCEILPIPFILLIGRWWWLLMTFNGWLTLGVMGSLSTYGCIKCAVGHRVAQEEYSMDTIHYYDIETDYRPLR